MAIMERCIWYIEDDPDIARHVESYLERSGYHVGVFGDGLSFGNAFARSRPDLLLLDWNMPDDSGDSLCRWVGSCDAELPIMMVTVRDDPADIVAGLGSGADDYVVKPFAPEVLASRIEALFRRIAPKQLPIACGDIRYDEATGIIYKGDARLELTSQEHRILLLFLENKGRILSRDAIRQSIWEIDGDFVNDNTLTVAIKRLRAKLGDADCLKTIRSFGYRMEEPS